MMATVPHVISGLGLRKFRADGFLLTRVYIITTQLIYMFHVILTLNTNYVLKYHKPVCLCNRDEFCNL